MGAELEYGVKSQGLSTTGGVYQMTAKDGSGFADQSTAAVGLHAQLGYVIDSMWQPVVRYALVAPDGSDNNSQAIGCGPWKGSVCHASMRSS